MRGCFPKARPYVGTAPPACPMIAPARASYCRKPLVEVLSIKVDAIKPDFPTRLKKDTRLMLSGSEYGSVSRQSPRRGADGGVRSGIFGDQ